MRVRRRYGISNNNRFYTLLMLFIVLFLGIGYAVINTKLTVNGTAKMYKNTWDVHFENIVKEEGSVTANTEAVITDDTKINFAVELADVGENYSFTVDVVNNGSIDAMLSEILTAGLSTAQKEYVDYTVAYADGEEVLEKDTLPSDKKDTLLVTVKYRDDVDVALLPIEDQSITLNLNLTYIQDDGTSSDRRPPRYLYDEIIAQNQENGVRVLDNGASTYVTATTGIDFGVAPSDTNGKGVYIRSGTESDTNPVYYYRGAVENNNVLFGGYCWKMVRTTETGGIKLIYNGVPTEGSCNNTGTSSQIGQSQFNGSSKSNAYVGYMYGTPNSSTYELEHLSTKESTSSIIKTYIDTWYSQNMTSYTSYLEDTIWCNDRSVITAHGATGTGAGTSKTYYGAYVRLAYNNRTPSLECVNQNDRFTVNETVEGRIAGNGALTYPVALLTADETTLGGLGDYSTSTSYSTSYLNIGEYWWSLSPRGLSGGDASEFAMHSAGLYSNGVNGTIGVRPSVSLKPGTQITQAGDGSVNAPFVVK